MADDNQETQSDAEPEAKALTLEDKIERLGSQGARQMWLAILLLVLMPVLFVVCVVSLASAVKTSDMLLAIEPGNRAGSIAKKIDKVKKEVEKQYAEHLVKMEDQTIFDVSKKFEVLYDLSQQSDADYGKMLSAWQQAVYQTASKVRGSGEWYFYYDQKLNRLVASQNRREKLMTRYFQKE